MSIKIASMNFGDCDTILHNTPNGMKNIAEVLGPNGEVYWSAIKELTSIPPLSIRSNGTMLLDYLISGNMSQSGTPTPDNPIQPQETGEKTGNLFDEVYSDIRSTIRYRPIFVGDGTFTLSTTTPYDKDVANIFLLSGNVSSGVSTLGNGVWKNHKVTAQSVNGYVTVAYRRYPGTTSPVDCQTMLNSGSTALPYEPYGYKIPISSAGQTTAVYLGEVETTRKIKKLVLTGEENWSSNHLSANLFNFGIDDYVKNTDSIICLCTHYKAQKNITLWTKVQDKSVCFFDTTNSLFYLRDSNFSTVDNFKSYLQQQYAAGTPITVWYVLATPRTGIVNEPLRKIRNYADTVSYEQAGVQIPTNKGNTVIDVETTLKPSQMYIKYK